MSCGVSWRRLYTLFLWTTVYLTDDMCVNKTLTEFARVTLHVVTYHQQLNCFFSSLLRLTHKKTLKHRITGLCEGNPPVTFVDSPHIGPALVRAFPYHDVIIFSFGRRGTVSNWSRAYVLCLLAFLTRGKITSWIYTYILLYAYNEKAETNLPNPISRIYATSKEHDNGY